MRPAGLLLAICVALGNWAVLEFKGTVPGPGSAAAQQGELLIEILPGGFNPPVCTINRNARLPVRFVNRDSKPRRIVVDALFEPEPGGFLRDTGWLAPGETQDGEWIFNEIQDFEYRDHDDPSLTGRIIVPLSNNADTSCARSELPVPGANPCQRLFLTPAGCVIVPRTTVD